MRHKQNLLLLASSLLASSCNRMGDPPRWWYSDHINRSVLCPVPYPTVPKHPGNAGRRAPASIQRIFREHYANFRRCYDALLKTNHEAQGKVQVHFTITPDGFVTTHCIDEDTTLDDEGLAECVLEEVSAMKFALDNNDYGYTTVVYPVVFSPAQK